MSEATPVFDAVAKEHKNKFQAFPPEYTDRYTPEVARHQGFVAGYNQAIGNVLTLAAEILGSKPTKQAQAIFDAINELELAE